ncbi:hypothetical protein [Rhodobaculum claviforme]|nr:hypothetical protein [Rhodobaculum claviforme]
MTPALLLFYATITPNPDQALFDYIGWISWQGGSYYADAFEINWPAVFLVHELGQRLFGAVPWAFRVFDYLVLLGVCAGVAWFLVQAGLARAAVLFALIYPPLYVTAGGWMSGQRDIMVGGLAFIALALALPRGRGDGIALVAAGAMLGLIVLIRPTWLALLALLLVAEVIGAARPSIRRGPAVAALAGGAVAVIAGAVGLGAASGTLRDWWEQAVLFVILDYRGTSPRLELLGTLSEVFLSWWHWPVALGLAGVVLWGASWSRIDAISRRALLLTLGVLGVVLLSYGVMNKGFQYHLGGALPVFVVWMCVLLDRTWSAAEGGHPRRMTAARGLLAGCAVLIVAGLGSKFAGFSPRSVDGHTIGAQGIDAGVALPLNQDARMALVDWIRAETDPQDRIFQWGWNYQIVQLAERLPSTRFITTPVIAGLNPRMPFHDDWVEEAAADFANHPPAVALLERAAVRTHTLPLETHANAPILLQLYVDRLNAGDYDIAFTFDDLLVLRHRP